MIVVTTRLEITTDEGVSLADITSEVNAFIKSSGVASGGESVPNSIRPGPMTSTFAAWPAAPRPT